MNREQFEGDWLHLKGKIKEKWGKLTDDDLTQINGKWDQLVGKLQKKYGFMKEQAEKELNAWHDAQKAAPRKDKSNRNW